MSAFLGPIHYWLYQKIEIQSTISSKIEMFLEEKQPEATKQLDQKYGEIATGELEEMINHENIHGWLQAEIVKTESRLAAAVTTLIEMKPDSMEAIRGIFYDEGVKRGKDFSITNAKEAFKAINDTLLDGMPCDHVNEIKEQDEEHVQWVRTTDIHKPHWDEVGGDSNHYHLLREAYIKGILKESDYGYGKAEENLFEIRRENKK